MTGAVLPGNSTVELRRFEVPAPGHGEVLIRMKAVTICGSDIHCIHREHTGKGPEGYQAGLIAGHEPCGQIVECGPGCRRFEKGDRVIVYHICGCGVCNDCRRGQIIGIDLVPERLELARSLRLCDSVLTAGPGNVAEVRRLTGGAGVERAFDCSANAEARLTAIQATRKWGRICLLGEGGALALQPSPDLIHDQKTIHGSWVTSLWLMEELVERLVRWQLHPERLITHRFPLERAAEAYALMASGRCGKVAVVFDEELSWREQSSSH